jgi:hypothetical protein
MQANRQEVPRARTGLRPALHLGLVAHTPAGERCCQGHCNKREGREMQLFRVIRNASCVGTPPRVMLGNQRAAPSPPTGRRADYLELAGRR